MAAGALLPTAAWADGDGSNRPYGEPPVGTTQSRPLGVEGDEGEGELGLRHPHLEFGDPLAQSLTYTPAVPRRPRFNVELRLMPYRPQVGDAAVRGVYDLVYVKGGHSIFPGRPLMYALAFDWFVERRLGLLGPYVRVGYWQATGATRVCQDADGAPVRCTAATIGQSSKGNDSGWLGIVPLTVGVVWRLDPLLARLRLPLGAAINVGLDYVLWWADNGGRRAKYGAHRAQGATAGLHVGGQLSLQLDALLGRHRPTSRTVAGTHLFADYQYSQGEALWGRHRAGHLNTHDRYMIAVGLGLRFY